MNQNIKSIIATLILITIFTISINYNYQKQYTPFCQNNISCILSLIEETQNYSLCNYTKNEDTQTCYNTIAINNNKQEYCKYTQNISNCYYNLALKYQNIENCKKTQNQESCIFQIAIAKNDSNICQNSQDIEYCYYSYAYNKKDIELCNLSGKYIQSCRKKVIIKNN